jgi:methyl-accepting chemotaxis protein
MSDRLLPIQSLNDSRAHSRAILMDVFQLMIITDEKVNAKLKQDINKQAAAVNKDLEEYEKTKLDPYEVEKLKDLHENLTKYREGRKAVMELALQNKNVEASTVLAVCGQLLSKALANSPPSSLAFIW